MVGPSPNAICYCRRRALSVSCVEQASSTRRQTNGGVIEVTGFYVELNCFTGLISETCLLSKIRVVG